MSDYQPLMNPKRRRRSADEQGFSEDFQTRFEPSDFAAVDTPVATVLDKGKEENSKAETEGAGNVQHFLKRGHFVSFVGLLLFTIFVYFRPYEYFPSLTFLLSGAKWIAGFTLLTFLPAQIALEGNLTTRPREVNLILLLVLLAFLSLITAISVSEGWDNLTEFLKVVAMFIVMINVVRTESRLRLMLWLALAVSVIISISAISDYQSGRLLTGGVRIKGSIGGLFENPNDLALHLVTMVPLAMALFLSSRGLSKLVYVVILILMVAGIICTFSRGGFLALMAVAFVLTWKFARKNRAMVIAISVIALLAIIIFAPAQYGGRLTSIWGVDATGSSNARQELFWRSLLVAARYPILGVGIGNFHFKSIHEQVSHNAFTQVASELGVTALVVYVMFLITPIRRLRKIEHETLTKHDKSKFYYLSVGLQTSLIGFMVASFFASVAFVWYLYFLVGYALCLARLYATAHLNELESSKREARNWIPSPAPKAEAL